MIRIPLLWKLPIKGKLILIIMVTSISVLLLAASAFSISEHIRARRSMVRDTSILAHLIASRSAAALLFDDPNLCQENLAALQGIPQELIDAANVDGAGPWARSRSVILPLLTPAIFFTGVLSLIGSFQVFDQIFVLIKPRPTDATITLVYFIYENGFKFFKMGYASAASWILFLIVAAFTAIYFWSQKRWVHYQ